MRVVEVILVLLFVVELPFPATVVVVGLVVVGLVEVAGLLTWGVTLGVLAWCGVEWLGLLCGCDACGLDAVCATARLVSRGSS